MSIRTTFLSLALALGVTSTAGAKPTAPARIEISVVKKGFSPDHVTVKKGESVVLAFTRKTDATCAKAVTVELGDGKKVTKELPLDKTVEIPATFAKTGELSYACSMDMIRGVMTVQ